MASVQLMDIHLHTVWSDGEDDPGVAIGSLARRGVSVIGICDHYGLAGTRSIPPGGLDAYAHAVRAAASPFAGRARVLCGAEIPLRLLLKGLSQEHIEGFNRLDFLLIEDLDHTQRADALSRLKAELGKLGCPVGLAHCDLARACGNLACSLDELAARMAERGLIYEVNAASRHACFDDIIGYDRGRSPEVTELFETLNRHRVRAAVGSDCHAADEYEAGRVEAANRVVAKYLMPYGF